MIVGEKRGILTIALCFALFKKESNMISDGKKKRKGK
jgi:hypothetical protein